MLLEIFIYFIFFTQSLFKHQVMPDVVPLIGRPPLIRWD